jgi:site-specific recombinase XerD
MNLTSFQEEFIIYLSHEKHVSPHTVEAYKRDLAQYFDDHTELTNKSITHHITHLINSHYKTSSIIRKISAIKSFANYLFREKIISTHPKSLINLPKKEHRLPKALKQTEITRLLETPLSARNKAILELLYGCGLRISECITLKKQDINLSQNTLIVTGKGNKQRKLPLGTKAKEALIAYLPESEDKNPFIFSGKSGKHIQRQTVFHLIKKLAKTTQLSYTTSPHTLRHSFATHLLEGEAKLRNIQALLGHKNITTTEIYTKVSTSHLKKAYVKSHPRAKVCH